MLLPSSAVAAALLHSLLWTPTTSAFAFHNRPLQWTSCGSEIRRHCYRYNQQLHLKTSISSSKDPHEGETPEERQARMELVRKIQSSFYRDDEDGEDEEGEEGDAGGSIEACDGSNKSNNSNSKSKSSTKWLQRDIDNHPSIIDNLPLWRVQWTEFPGYQNVLNVHVPHYTHMFRKLTLQHDRPWYYGHVYLPDGSENIGNPEYFFPDNDNEDVIAGGGSGGGGGKQTSKATTVGTLMQITDVQTQEDGRLTLIVQGVGRFKVLKANQHVPYALAKVKLMPDQEESSIHFFSAAGSAPVDYDLSMAILHASQDVTVMEDEMFRELEYYRTTFGDVDGISGVSPLSNINGTASINLERMKQVADRTFAAGVHRNAQELGSDEILLASSTLKLTHGAQCDDIPIWEAKVWIQLDRMIRLLQSIQPDVNIPIPSQLLGLLPTDVDWPEDFQLESHAQRLEVQETLVGTLSKSPFVRISAKYPEYPNIRRGSRLSYAVWMLLPFGDRQRDVWQRLLETYSIVERLELAYKELKKLNSAIEVMRKQ